MKKETKITKEELDQLQSLVNSEQRMVQQLGVVCWQLETLTKQKQELIDNINSFQQVKEKQQKILEEKYGPGQLNIETGELSSTK